MLKVFSFSFFFFFFLFLIEFFDTKPVCGLCLWGGLFAFSSWGADCTVTVTTAAISAVHKKTVSIELNNALKDRERESV